MFPIASFAAAQDTSISVVHKNNQSQSNESIQNDIQQLNHDVKTVSSDVEILRRDQINYRVEKDILKEAYSSNLQSVNIIITIVFGIFGVLGYLGIRSIKEIKLDYANELNDLKSLKAKFEAELLQFENKQKEFELKVSELAKTNEEQDRRLKVLELIEKAAEYIKSKQWHWALQYIAVGLDIDSNNDVLLKQKAMCHGKLGEDSLALDARRRVLELQPDNFTNVTNMLEILAMTNQLDEFDKVYSANKDRVDRYHNGALIIFLKTLLGLVNGDVISATKDLESYAKKFLGETKQHIGNWSFDEVAHVISKMPVGKARDLLVLTVQFFDGKISSDDLVTHLT
jgi:hypothetical protein